jgi:hypothetical protein
MSAWVSASACAGRKALRPGNPERRREYNGWMNQKVPPIYSECPNCHQDRIVTYTGDELIELLREGAEIEARCTSCDEHWAISTEERADIARSIERHGR